MNIFATYSCPAKSAAALDDKRVVKMVLESAQLLNNVAAGPLEFTHMDHPATLWAKKSKDNYAWLLNHFYSLLREYSIRYKKAHKYSVILPGIFANHFRDGHTLPPTNFVNITDLPELPTHAAYRLYLEMKWTPDFRAPTWYGKPDFPGWR